MTKDAESHLLHKAHDRKPEIARMRSPVSAWITGLATIMAIVACLAFSIFFHRALSGFSKQVNAFVSVGDFSSVLLQAVVFVVSAAVVVYLLFVYLASEESKKCTHYYLIMYVFSSNIFKRASGLWFTLPSVLLIVWLSRLPYTMGPDVVLCVFSVLRVGHNPTRKFAHRYPMSTFFTMERARFIFCLLGEFTPSVRSLINNVSTSEFSYQLSLAGFSNKKVDMVFCAEKKELLCSQENNQIWNFLAAFICCVLTFAAVLFVQNCVVYGFGKRQAAKEYRRRENYEMKTLNS
ncbi:hypothetical protein OSTOST_02542 [Ostertagia ostertagi]